MRKNLLNLNIVHSRHPMKTNLLGAKIACLILGMSACGMAKRSYTKWYNVRDVRHAAYVFDAESKVFRNSKCLKRNSKLNCLEWEHHTLNPLDEKDAIIIEGAILIPEAEL